MVPTTSAELPTAKLHRFHPQPALYWLLPMIFDALPPFLKQRLDYSSLIDQCNALPIGQCRC